MTWELALMTLSGATVGAGLWMALTPHSPSPGRVSTLARVRAGLAGPAGIRLAAGVVAGLVVLVLTRWVPVAAAVTAVVLAWPALFGAASEQRATIARLEALASWIEALRDTIATGRGLPEALPAASSRSNPALAGPLRDVVVRMQAREPIGRVLLLLADDIDDPIADQAIAALILNAREQGRQLQSVLTGLATSTRREVETRRTVEAQRRATRRDVLIIMVATVVMTVGMAVFARDYVRPYSTLTGQVVLSVAIGFFAAGFLVMQRLSRYTTAERFLNADDTARDPARHGGTR